MKGLLGPLPTLISAFMIECGLGQIIPSYGKISKSRIFGIFLILWAVHGQFITTIEDGIKYFHQKSPVESKEPSPIDSKKHNRLT